MAKIGIICALDCEIEMFIKDFAAKNNENEHIYKGTFAGHEIYLTLCGIGKVNAAVCTQRLIDFVSPDAIINSGVAGGVSDKLGVCDLAISDKLTYHDFSPLDCLDKYAPGCSVFVADKRLVSLAENAAEKLIGNGESFVHETGMIVSGDMFVEDESYNQRLKRDFDAVCTEMEGAAVAHTAILSKIPFLVIRAISDNADGDANMSFEQMCGIAAKRACYIVKEIIKQY